MLFVDGFPVPVPTRTSEPYWRSLREHRIRIQYSPSSDAWVFYPRLRAPGTLADDLVWREISGRGVLVAYTTTSRPTGPPWRDSLPQRLAIVQWDEGPRVTTELVAADGSAAAADATWPLGSAVEPVFVDLPGADVTLLKYCVLRSETQKENP